MKLGLKRDEVKLVPYTSEWKTEFLKVKQELIQATNIEDNRIEHIGSTAITDMDAKPIIDILIGSLDYELKDQAKLYLPYLQMILMK